MCSSGNSRWDGVVLFDFERFICTFNMPKKTTFYDILQSLVSEYGSSLKCAHEYYIQNNYAIVLIINFRHFSKPFCLVASWKMIRCIVVPVNYDCPSISKPAYNNHRYYAISELLWPLYIIITCILKPPVYYDQLYVRNTYIPCSHHSIGGTCFQWLPIYIADSSTRRHLSSGSCLLRPPV